LLAAILSQGRFAIYGLLAAGLVIGGWTANGWRLEAANARGLRAALQSEMAARVEADAARVALGMQLSEAEAAIITGTKVVREKVKTHVPASADCNIPDGFRLLLERARSGLPPAADPTPTAPAQP
jgi:hypothetical protein